MKNLNGRKKIKFFGKLNLPSGLVIILFLFSLCSKSQLVSNLTIPSYLKFNYQAKYNTDKEIYKEEYTKYPKLKTTFDNNIVHANYELNLLYKSGKLVFNDKISGFVSNVFQKVLVNYPEVANWKIYILRSTEVNAFIYHTGEVFVTLGLLAQLENESQLAFVLAHEFSHHKLKHHITSIIKNEEIYRNRKNGTELSEESNELVEFAFSREHEFEADSSGFCIVKASPYLSSTSIGAVDVLQYSYLPFNEIVFKPKNLFTDSIRFPSIAMLDKINSINFDSDKDEDLRSTHPNIAKRRKHVSFIATKIGHNKGSSFIVGKKEFMEVRNLAREECINSFVRESEAIYGFYNAYVLSRENKNAQADLLLGKALYEIAMQKQFDKFSANNSKNDFSEGEIQRAYHFFNNLDAEQCLFMALNFNYTNYIKYKSEFSKVISDELIKTIVLRHSITLDEIKSYFITPAVKDSIETVSSAVDSADMENVSKYSRIREQKVNAISYKDTSVINSGAKFHYKFFQQLIKDTNFCASYLAMEDIFFKEGSGKKYDDESVRVTFVSDNKITYNTKNQIECSSAILFCPLFRKRISTFKDFFDLQTNQERFSSSIGNYFSKSQAPVEPLTFETMNITSNEEYNKYCNLMDYGDEVIRKNGLYMPISAEVVGTNEAIQKNSHLIMCRYAKNKEYRTNITQAILNGIIAFPLLPAALIYCFSKESKERCDIIIIDLKTHELKADEHIIISESKFSSAGNYFSSFIK